MKSRLFEHHAILFLVYETENSAACTNGNLSEHSVSNHLIHRFSRCEARLPWGRQRVSGGVAASGHLHDTTHGV